MYKKVAKIVRGAMIVYVIYIVFPNECEMIIDSIFMIFKGAFMWLWDVTKDSISSGVSSWWDGCKESVIEWVKAQIMGGK